jgi:alkanesulfonate monooxygenase SsuD/methylene tetrahydromethanopterin reductase-like flavin-dependent oxidoreductase (luciferase family)
MPERSVLPKPVQKPHPPLWVTVTSPGTELDAAERGIGCLGVAPAGYAEQEQRTREYHRRIQSCDPVSPVVNDCATTLNFMYCHEDVREAARAGVAMVGRFGAENSNLVWTREVYPSRAYQLLANLAPGIVKRGAASNPGDGPALPEGICVGDPQRLVRVIKEWESIGVDGINFLLNGCETLSQAQVLESMRLFAREVMPAFPKES